MPGLPWIRGSKERLSPKSRPQRFQGAFNATEFFYHDSDPGYAGVSANFNETNKI